MKKYVAEVLGTFALVFIGTGAIVVNQATDGSLGLIGIAMAFGFVIMGVIYILGGISGAHINPAVSLALAFGGKFSWREVMPYILAQLLGAFLASGALLLIFPDTQTLGQTLPAGAIMQSFLLEVILTFLLMLSVLGPSSSKHHDHLTGLVVGLFIICLILVGGPISGGSFNPARSLAPAVFSGDMTAIWIYMLAPVLGAVLAVWTWQFLTGKVQDR